MRTIEVPSHFKITQEQYNNLTGKDLVTIECLFCLKDFIKTKRDINRQVLDKKEPIKYCSRTCLIKSLSVSITKPCSNCGEEVTRKLSELKKAKTDNIFCNRSCSATFNNKHRPKKAQGKYIKTKGECLNCHSQYTKEGVSKTQTCSQLCSMELGMKQRYLKDALRRGGSNKYDTVRQNSRTYSKYFYPTLCMLCGYDKHYEVCHVKDLKDFTGEETIFEVNNKENLIHLCPNCHWEFDHNQINITTIKQAQKDCSLG